MDYASAMKGWLAARAKNADLRQTSFGFVWEARGANVLFPGSLTFSPEGNGGITVMGEGDSWGAVSGWLNDAGFRAFRPAMNGLDYFDAASPPPWVLQPFDVASAPLTLGAQQALSATLALLQQRILALGVIPSASMLIALPRTGLIVVPDPSSSPSWAYSQQQRDGWSQIAAMFTPIVKTYLDGNLEQAAAETANANANAAFWDGVRRVTLAVATLGVSELIPEVQAKWTEMQDKIRQYNLTRAAGLRIAGSPATDPGRSQQIRATIADQDASITGTITQYLGQAPGLDKALKQEGLGFLEAFAGLAVAVQIGIIVAIIAAIGAAIYALHQLGVVADDVTKSATTIVAFGMLAALGIGGWWWYKHRRSPA